MTFGPDLFRDDAIDPDTAKLNQAMIDLMTPLAEWWNTGAAAYRQARREGRGPFPPPVFSSRATTREIDGHAGNKIPLRIIPPAGTPTGAGGLYVTDGAAVFGVTIAASGLTRVWRAQTAATPVWVRQ